MPSTRSQSKVPRPKPLLAELTEPAKLMRLMPLMRVMSLMALTSEQPVSLPQCHPPQR